VEEVGEPHQPVPSFILRMVAITGTLRIAILKRPSGE
jgi:hypothetical protein